MPSSRPTAHPEPSRPAQLPWWERAARALGDRLRPPARLQPQPIGVGVGGPSRRAAVPPEFTLRVFGRRRDEPGPDEDGGSDSSDAAGGGEADAEPHKLDLPAWAPRAIQPDPPDAVGERVADAGEGSDAAPTWLTGAGAGEAEPPVSVGTEPDRGASPGWAVVSQPAWSGRPPLGPTEGTAADQAAAPETPAGADTPAWAASPPAAELPEVGGASWAATEGADALAADPAPAAADPDPVPPTPPPAVAAGWDQPRAPEPVVPPAVGGAREPLVRPRPLAEPRPLPLPEGEMVFRNLRTAFTDPARLLRHLGEEGHTGVMEVLGARGRESYVVLLEGAVVGVAVESDTVLQTVDRLAFPSFPGGQDTLNVVRYPPEIARALGLLLHAPVYFSGLGAAFINLDGLEQYLEQQRADGGLLVMSGQDVGVALFTAGRLVGAYTSSDAGLGDLERIRPLVADASAQIDVRMGGPAEVSSLPMDQLLGPGA